MRRWLLAALALLAASGVAFAQQVGQPQSLNTIYNYFSDYNGPYDTYKHLRDYIATFEQRTDSAVAPAASSLTGSETFMAMQGGNYRSVLLTQLNSYMSGPVVNVTNSVFGIKTDCSQDATAALQAAINGAPQFATIYFPPTICVRFSNITLPSNISFSFRGATLRQNPSVNTSAITLASAQSNVVIDGGGTGLLDANGNTYAFGVGFVWFSQCTDCVVQNAFINAQSGADNSTRVIFYGNHTSGGSILFNACTSCMMLANRNTGTPAGGNAFTVNDTVNPSRYVKIIGNIAHEYSRICIEIVNNIGGGTIEYTYDEVISNECDSTQNPGGGFPWGISNSISGGNTIIGNHVNIPTAQGDGFELIGPDNYAAGNVVQGGANSYVIDGTGDAASSTYRLKMVGNSAINPGQRCYFAINGIQDLDFSHNSCSITNAAVYGFDLESDGATSRITLSNNPFSIASTDVVDSVYCFLLAGGSQISLAHNDCSINFAANHTDEAGVRLGASEPDFVLTDNLIIAASANFGQGVYAPGAGGDRWKIRDNKISGFNNCISIAAGVPILYDNNLSNCTTNYAVVNGIPTTGTWVQGDFVPDIATANGLPQGWRATAGGTPGTWEAVFGAGSQDALTAHSGGGQGSATPLVFGTNRASTVAVAADSVILPSAIAGGTVYFRNDGANSANLFPASGQTINGLAANTAIAVAAGKTAILQANSSTAWTAGVPQ